MSKNLYPIETDVSKTDSRECWCADYVQRMAFRLAALKREQRKDKNDRGDK